MTIYRLQRRPERATGSLPPPASLADDPSLREGVASHAATVDVSPQHMRELFLERAGIGYVAEHFAHRRGECRVVTHPKETTTCYEKADLLGDFSPLDVIKTLYFAHPRTGGLWGIVVPETGCFLSRATLAGVLGCEDAPAKASALPTGMTIGTCSPFVTPSHLEPGPTQVERLVFDTETLVMKRNDRTLDDFSLNGEKKQSVQMNYFDCYDMLRQRHPGRIADAEVLTTSFKETFVRRKGRLSISYDISSISYRMALMIQAMHGAGEVSVTNDYVDELDLPAFPALRQRESGAS